MEKQLPIEGQVQEGNSTVKTKKVCAPELDEAIDPTAGHEGAHSAMAFVLDVGIEIATNEPGPGYSGYMKPNSCTDYEFALIAAAAEAKGYDGTGAGDEPEGSDMWLIRQLGFEPSTVVSHARSLLSSAEQEEKIDAIATQIQRQKTIGNDTAQKAVSDVEKGTIVKVEVSDKQESTPYQTTLSVPNRAKEITVEIPKETPVQEDNSE